MHARCSMHSFFLGFRVSGFGSWVWVLGFRGFCYGPGGAAILTREGLTGGAAILTREGLFGHINHHRSMV